MAFRVEITEGEANRRLDRFLFAYLRDAPHPLVYKLLRKKRIKLNRGKADGAENIVAGDVLDFYLAPDTLADLRGVVPTVPQAVPLDGIIYEDAEILVVNKPAGLSAHGGGKLLSDKLPTSNDHLLTRVVWYLHTTGAYDPAGTFTPALCNRLDTNTSGLVVCGKTLTALQKYTALFAAGSGNGANMGNDDSADSTPRVIVKEYLALAEGTLQGEATLTGIYTKNEATNTAKITPLIHPPADNTNTPPHKLAITHYRVIAHSTGGNKNYTLLSIRLQTGRSHQIRAHLSAIKHPLAGDRKYGGASTPYAPAQLLHAWRLITPDNAFIAPPPEGFMWCLRDWFSFADISVLS
ncbi:MAG: RluA family pseudouridine synthase [Defluviitaleaceae bacterium]|nr:RluA family pseudouridine synthase [Defluviitaleaceae bacterium]